MLYIHRIIPNPQFPGDKGKSKFSIVDTDDGVETLVTWDQLEAIVCNADLPILGVTKGEGSGVRKTVMLSATVYKGKGRLPAGKLRKHR